MKKSLSLIIIILLYSQAIYSQYDRFNHNNRNRFTNKINYFNFGKTFYSEIHYLPYKQDSSSAIILFRMSYDLLNFEKYSQHSNNNDIFFAVPTVDAEFEDSEGIIRKRIVWQDTIFTDDFNKTNSKTDFIKGKLLTIISKKNYIVTIRLSDKGNHNIKKMILKDSLSHNYLANEIISKPIFTYIENIDSQNYYPYNSSNSINFSSKNSLILIPVSYSNEFVKYYYHCSYIKSREATGLQWKSDYNISGFLVPKKNSTLQIKDDFAINIVPFIKKANYKVGVLMLPLPTEKIVPGNYELKIAKNNSSDTLTYHFKVAWENMPLVLGKLDLAIKSMYYILSDKDYEKMLDADKDNYSNEILKYWEKQDPTKSTPYNEAMTEYFKRVDYAIFNFQTFTQKNGLKTDKAKIYILYGEPTEINKDFKDQNTYEIWDYTHLKKEFIFLRSENDKYKLVDIKKKK